MGQFKDLTGQVFGRLTVVEKSHSLPRRGWFWKCKCECGNECIVNSQLLTKGETRSCKCLFTESRATCHKTHGMSYTTEYTIYNTMLHRCYSENNKQYADYGGRGITVCDRWLESFENFYKDMGPRPKGKTLERADNNLNYCKENCVWETRKEQGRNKSNNHKYEYKGQMYTAGQLSELTGIPEKTLVARLTRLKWPVEKAAETPVRTRT